MADYLTAPLAGEMLNAPAVPRRRSAERDLLDYYLGPTGVVERAGAANEMLNPIVAISDAGQDLRRGDYLGALTNTAAAAVPIAGGRMAMRAARGVPSLAPREYDEAASALTETLTGVSAPKPSEATDMTRRQFLTGAAAAGGTAAMGPDLLELAKKAAPDVARQVNPLQASIGKLSSASKDLNKLAMQIFDIQNKYAVARKESGSAGYDYDDLRADEMEELAPLYEQRKALNSAREEALNSVEDLAGQDAELFQKYVDEIMSDLSAEDGEALIRLQEDVEDDILTDIYTRNAEVEGDPGDPYLDFDRLKEAEDLTGTVEDGRGRIRLLELLEQSGAPYDKSSLDDILAKNRTRR